MTAVTSKQIDICAVMWLVVALARTLTGELMSMMSTGSVKYAKFTIRSLGSSGMKAHDTSIEAQDFVLTPP